VVEGEEADIKFVATRVAYSCFGQVRSLAGHAVPKATVQARGGEDEYEETVSDREGNYRLRGLKSGVQYAISVLVDGVRVERSSPTTQSVSVANEDVHAVNFLSFRSPSTVTIAGHVNTDTEYLSTLSVGVLQCC
jgi:BOS complex subunit NOMO